MVTSSQVVKTSVTSKVYLELPWLIALFQLPYLANSPWISFYLYCFCLQCAYCTHDTPILIGFLDKEIEKADIHVRDVDENPEAPQPRDMIDLEVGIYT